MDLILKLCNIILTENEKQEITTVTDFINIDRIFFIKCTWIVELPEIKELQLPINRKITKRTTIAITIMRMLCKMENLKLKHKNKKYSIKIRKLNIKNDNPLITQEEFHDI